MLLKNQVNTFNNGRLESNLDHVIATTNINFEATNNVAVEVNGWVDLHGSERDYFINKISDHCSLYCKIL